MNNNSRTKHLFRIVTVALVLFFGSQSVRADLHEWKGGNGGLWSTSANWIGGSPSLVGFELPPVVLLFPSVPAYALNTTNDLPSSGGFGFTGLFNQMYIEGNGYTFYATGSATNFTYTSSGGYIVVTGSNNVFASTFNLVLPAGTNNWIGVASNLSFTVSSVIRGEGGLSKYLGGELILSGSSANTYSNTTCVTDGTLTLAKNNGITAVPADIIIGADVNTNTAKLQLNTDNQIANTSDIVINANATFNLNDQNETVNNLAFVGGDVTTGTGLLTVNGDVTSSFTLLSSSAITGKLSIGSDDCIFDVTSGVLTVNAVISDSSGARGYPDITKTGSGSLVLGGNNTHRGQTIAAAGTLQLNAINALGATNGNTVVSNGATLYLTGLVVTNETLSLAGAGAFGFGALRADNTNTWSGPITLTADAVIGTGSTNAKLTLSGVISGPGGPIFTNGGTFVYSGTNANTYTGPTIVADGKLQVGKSLFGFALESIPGALIIGQSNGIAGSDIVQLTFANQIANSANVTINQTGSLDLNNLSDSIGSLALTGGKVTTGTGTLTLLGDVSTSTGNSSSIAGNLSLGGVTRTINCAIGGTLSVTANISDGGNNAGILKAGPGNLQLNGTNTYAGATTISNGAIVIYHAFSLGSTNGATTVLSNAILNALNATNVAEPLVLNGNGGGFGALLCFGSNLFTGPITLGSDSTINVGSTNDFANITGVISGLAGFTKDGSGKLQLSGSSANTYASTTFVKAGTLELNKTNGWAVPNPLVIGDGTGGTNADVVRLLKADQIGDVATVNIASSGYLDLNNFAESVGSLASSGNIALGTGSLTSGIDGSSTIVSGAITGSASAGNAVFVKKGTGTMTLNAACTYSGDTTVMAGTLLVNGTVANAVKVSAGAMLGGSGAVGAVTCSGGTITPGSSPGKLNTGTLSYTTNSVTLIELNGTTAGANYDQVNVTGGITLNGALNISLGFQSAISNKFTILQNDGSDAVSGTFTGLPEGATFVRQSRQFKISYVGGDGNDVVLTQVSAVTAPSFSSIQMQSGHSVIQGMGLSGTSYTVEASTNLTIWNPIGVATSDANGLFQYDDSDALILPYRFYRMVEP